ncbi:hypothetical protein MLD38_030516 [Melastoma candidum]|uniref:Uncharacterized protein n=1 Tax=Melastoma candidum TaxID=119954 RepID=A0ACB9MLN0_9MYRT|nr:hypothetical protein MLD38_030516 [Melastoma candidum]
MGCFQKLFDGLLLVYFLFMAVIIPLFDGQSCIPRSFFPDILVNLKDIYAREYGDYLVAERPHFFVGLVGLELAFHWPLCLANLVGILGSKPWFPTTCLVYGVSLVTSMAAILPDLMWSSKSSDKLVMVYSPFLGIGVLAMLRGLLSHSRKTPFSAGGSRPSLVRKKRA